MLSLEPNLDLCTRNKKRKFYILVFVYMLTENMTFSQCWQWLVNNDNDWFIKELTSITSHWW